jgi:Ulp1 family protease
MHVNENHWALLVLNFKKKEVQILDSLGGRHKKVEKALVSTYHLHIMYQLLFIQLQLQIDQNSHVSHHPLGRRHTEMHRLLCRQRLGSI